MRNTAANPRRDRVIASLLIAAVLIFAWFLFAVADDDEGTPSTSSTTSPVPAQLESLRRRVAELDAELRGEVHKTNTDLSDLRHTVTTLQRAARTSRTPRVATASTGTAAAYTGNSSGSVNGYPCGGDLPPCAVLRRESGGDPRKWNGGCYAPVGWTGRSPCGTSSASGLWQFVRGTWNGYGGYLNAADAPAEVQNEKARLAWAGGRGCSHWKAC